MVTKRQWSGKKSYHRAYIDRDDQYLLGKRSTRTRRSFHSSIVSRDYRTMNTFDLAPFLAQIRKLRIAFGLFACLSLPGGFLILCAMVFAPQDRIATRGTDLAAELGVSGLLLGFGAFSTVQALRSPLKYKGIRTLLERKEDIVWIVPIRLQQNGSFVAMKYELKLFDGTSVDINCAAAAEERADSALRTHCAHARFGYNRDWDKQFRANPSAFRNKV
jgi:hypothetical protein